MSTVTTEEADMQAFAKRVKDETDGLAVVEEGGSGVVLSGLTESQYIAASAVAGAHGLRKDVGAFEGKKKWRFVPRE